jgi:putative acetyltransferase
MAFYERHGYGRIPSFGHYAGSTLSVCYERVLDTAPGRANGPFVR